MKFAWLLAIAMATCDNDPPPPATSGIDATTAITQSAAVNSQVIFDATTAPSLEPFSLMVETPAAIVGPTAHWASLPEGVTGLPGAENYTAYEFAKLPSENFALTIIERVPAGAPYSNSGIYLLYTDPHIELATLTSAQVSAVNAASAAAAARRAEYGAGPFELDFFAHEVQILSGTMQPEVPANQRNAALYNVDIGAAAVRTAAPRRLPFVPRHALRAHDSRERRRDRRDVARHRHFKPRRLRSHIL